MGSATAAQRATQNFLWIHFAWLAVHRFEWNRREVVSSLLRIMVISDLLSSNYLLCLLVQCSLHKNLPSGIIPFSNKSGILSCLKLLRKWCPSQSKMCPSRWISGMGHVLDWDGCHFLKELKIWPKKRVLALGFG